MEKELNGVIFYDDLAEIASELDEEEIQYMDLIENLSDQIYEFMKKQNMNKSDLAQLMEVSRSYVTQILQGKNISIKTLNKILYSMEGKFNFKIIKKDENIRWFGVVGKKKHNAYKKKDNYFYGSEQKGKDHYKRYVKLELNVA
ncbi:MAG: helix-turn-helix transcriptional regulator [Desulfohalobiaceae bacterium]|nr:helix-turn-helix transcriptional regulator [Desulfohalobiaceae bacterium]